MHIEALMKNKKVQRTNLFFAKMIAYGGDGMNKSWEADTFHFLKEHHAPYGLMNGYGMAEMAGSVCTSNHKFPVMLPFFSNNIKILDIDTGEELGYDQEGEICVSGPGMMNDEMLRFYWKLGKGISSMSEQFGYGMGFYKTVSDDLKSILPDVKSFSPTNLKYMRYFYEMYPDAVICPQVEDELITDANRPQVGDDLQIIFRIPWGHNKIILDKCKGNSAKALFYIRKTIENNWSRDVLLNFLGTDLYERQGKAITNFSNTLPVEQSDLAQAITKDPYNFDFLTLRERYDEKELKDALIEKVNNFLMELGTGFAYMGREVRIEVGDTEKFIDMLFYNTQRHCYVVVEIKTGKFDSSYAGQLGTYVVAVNHQMKTEADNPTLGLLICKDMDKVEAQYALESTSQPLGISSYELSKLIPEEFKGSMPTIEEIEAELNE